MTKIPFAIPAVVEPRLAMLHRYWEGLRRGENDMPFWDDVSTTALPELASHLILMDAFDKPMRFRFGFVGQEIEQKYQGELRGKFADEITLREPLHYLNSQCSATIEGRKPTYYHFAPDNTKASERYRRMFLPMWGDGHISMLLGAIVWD